jgi:hypothetical protein
LALPLRVMRRCLPNCDAAVGFAGAYISADQVGCSGNCARCVAVLVVCRYSACSRSGSGRIYGGYRGGGDILTDSDGVKTDADGRQYFDMTPTFRGAVMSYCYMLRHGDAAGQVQARDWLLAVGDVLDAIEAGETVNIRRGGAPFTAARTDTALGAYIQSVVPEHTGGGVMVDVVTFRADASPTAAPRVLGVNNEGVMVHHDRACYEQECSQGCAGGGENGFGWLDIIGSKPRQRSLYNRWAAGVGRAVFHAIRGRSPWAQSRGRGV